MAIEISQELENKLKTIPDYHVFVESALKWAINDYELMNQRRQAYSNKTHETILKARKKAKQLKKDGQTQELSKKQFLEIQKEISNYL